MTRWLILMGTLLAWIFSMAVVYQTYGPQPATEEVLEHQETLDEYFRDQTPNYRSWKVYLDPDKLNPSKKQKSYLNPLLTRDREQALATRKASAAVEGAFPGELQVGMVDLKIVRTGASRIEQHASLSVKIPKGINMTLLQLFGDMSGKITSYISMDNGLENFTSEFLAGHGWEVLSKGNREGESLVLTHAIFNMKKNLAQRVLRFKVPRRVVPSMTFSLFQDRPAIKEKDSWQIPTLELNSTTREPTLSAVRAEVIEKSSILYYGKMIHVFHVQASMKSLKNPPEAWYSAAGHVMKARFTFAELFPLTLVREPHD